MKKRPLTNVVYELELIGEEGEIMEEFSISYDSELYDSDKESTDSIAINMKVAELKEKHGEDLLLLNYSISRGLHIVH
ncbi:hypothetical protein [Bacillus paranthracis]|uniref:hypothetical protein n=1 Tax=Bacillus paranthracis TaxID=2026186 RepID=UPI002D7A3452|nr:hypothetical protein [Bacillus paranthracis]